MFINLEKDVERRAFVERNFSDVAIDGWRLTRFPAADRDEIDRLGVQGAVTPAEKACFFSHRSLVQSRLHGLEPVLVVEDDVLFHEETFAIVDRILPTLPPHGWDLIFLDVCITDAKAMVDLFMGERTRPGKAHFALIELKTMMFAGATSYIINGRSKYKISRLLDQERRIDTPYDLYLRNLTWGSQLNAYMIFPFISTLSKFGDVSTIKGGGERQPDRIWNEFRRFMWIGRDRDSQRAAVAEQFARLCDEDMRTFAMLLGPIVSLMA